MQRCGCRHHSPCVRVYGVCGRQAGACVPPRPPTRTDTPRVGCRRGDALSHRASRHAAVPVPVAVHGTGVPAPTPRRSRAAVQLPVCEHREVVVRARRLWCMPWLRMLC